MQDHREAFRAAIINAGLTDPGSIDITGKENYTRWRCSKKTGKNGAYSYDEWMFKEKMYASGAFQDHCAEGPTGGELIKWQSWNDQDAMAMDPEHLAMIEKRNKEAIQKQRTVYNETADLAAKRFSEAQAIQSMNDHPYLVAKQIAKCNSRYVRISGNTLLINMHNDKNITRSLQVIYEDKENPGKFIKQFMKNSSVKGLYNSIAPGVKGPDDIWIAEGFSTASAVVEITGCICAIAFSAANMVAVAKTLRAKFPDRNIHIAGDPGLAGEEKAHQAALVTGGMVAIPPAYEQLDDWNDCVTERGLKKAKEMFAATTQEPNLVKKAVGGQPEPELVALLDTPASETAWRESLLMTQARGSNPPEIKSCIANYRLFIENHDDFADMFAYSNFEYRPVINRYPHWWANDDDRALPRSLDDHDMTDIQTRLQELGLTSIKKHDAEQVVLRACQRLKIHPVQDHLNALVWDGQTRINTWLSDYCGADNSDIVSQFGRKWLIAAMARIMQPGCKVDTMLILEGEQGAGKSQLAHALSFGYFTDEHLDPKNAKESAMLLHGSWIVEVAELSSLKHSQTESSKAFYSRSVDKFRPPYERGIKEHPRQQIFIGTTNTDDYLKDSTGNRRYWPVKISNINIKKVIENREQLWAEALVQLKAGEQWWLDDEFSAQAMTEQKERMAIDSNQLLVEEYIKNGNFQCVTWQELWRDVLHEVFKNTDSNNVQRNITRILRSMGWQYKQGIRLPWCPNQYGHSWPRPWVAPGADVQSLNDIERLRMSPEYRDKPRKLTAVE